MTNVACKAVVLFVAALASVQAPVSPTQPPTFRAAANLVALNVTVLDRESHYVTGLKPSDFAVDKDGVQQEIRFFEASAVPVDLMVLLDVSSSMSDKMDVVHEAAIGFLRTLRSGDRGSVIAFGDSVSVLQELTGDRDALERAVVSTHARGGTALNNALYVALREFGRFSLRNEGVRRQAIAVVTDGDDTSSLVSFDDVLSLARGSGVTIYTVGLQTRAAAERLSSDAQHRYLTESDYALKTLARETGAQAFFLTQMVELKGIYASIAADLANQYSIGYEPTSAKVDGRFRQVAVRMVSRPELRPRTRLGYTVAADKPVKPDSPAQQP